MLLRTVVVNPCGEVQKRVPFTFFRLSDDDSKRPDQHFTGNLVKSTIPGSVFRNQLVDDPPYFQLGGKLLTDKRTTIGREKLHRRTIQHETLIQIHTYVVRIISS